jgi:hypothetical protein
MNPFKRKPCPEEVELNAEITRVLAVIARMEPDHPEYTTAVKNLAVLYAQKETLPVTRISPDTIVNALSYAFGLALITQYERANVFAGQAIKFVRKLKD